MAKLPLQGAGVLIARPREQAGELATAIEAAGGTAIMFPALSIEPIEPQQVVDAANRLHDADIAVFVSPNAVRHGLPYSGNAIRAAIGPATAAALRAAGHPADIVPYAEGFDSESLLAEAPLCDVRSKVVRIIRGTDGRELLGNVLRQRGAKVDYLATYRRVAATPDAGLLADIETRWRDNGVNAVVVMSIDTLINLQQLLPPWCAERLAETPLVTPASRVIKDVLERFPAAQPMLASGPDTDALLRAIVKALDTTG